MSGELKPCPVCGREAELRQWQMEKFGWTVRCAKCELKPETCVYADKDKAVAAWNTRPQPAEAKDAGREAAGLAKLVLEFISDVKPTRSGIYEACHASCAFPKMEALAKALTAAKAPVDEAKAELERDCPVCGEKQVGTYMHSPRLAPVYWHKDGRPDNCKPSAPAPQADGALREALHPGLLWFAKQMQVQLDRNADKGDWTDDVDWKWVISGLKRNVQDLERGDGRARIRTCADLANFAAMWAIQTPEGKAALQSTPPAGSEG